MARLFLSLFGLALLAGGCSELGTGQLNSITILPSTAIVGINKTQSFTAVGYNSLGTIVSVTPSWTVSSGIGTIDTNGLFTAASAAGTGSITASAEGVNASATVTVTNEAKISGAVSDQAGQKISSIKVFSRQNSSRYATTDLNGAYSFWTPAGTQEIKTDETLLYLSSSSEIYAASGESTAVNLTLAPRLALSNINVVSSPFVQITYTVTNAGSREVKQVAVTYTIYNRDNQIIASGSNSYGNMTAGQAQTATVSPGVSSVNYGRYSLSAAGQSF